MSNDFEPEFDVHKSVQALMGEAVDLSYVEHGTEYALQKLLTKPARRLNAVDLHFLVQHGVALGYVVPLAIVKLGDDPFLQAEQYPGDLLTRVLEVNATFWQDRHDLWCAMIPVLEAAVDRINQRATAEERGDYLPEYLGDDFIGALVHFRGIHAE
jgi:hypothetical protein